MRKLFVVCYLLMTFMLCKSFISCKNEEKSQQLDNSSTSQTSDNTASEPGKKPSSDLFLPLNTTNVETSVPIIKSGIYQDADSLYHLRYILEVGKTYLFNTKEVNKQTISFRDKKQSITQESFDPINFTVLEAKDGKYTLQVKMGGKKVITKADGQQVVFDTNGKKPEDANQAKMWKVYKAISHITFTLDMDIYGNVSNIKGMDAIYEKAKTSLSGDLKGKELDEFINAFKQGLNPEIFKAQFESSIMRFPPKGLKIGEKWNNDPNQKNRGFNQLVKVDNATTEVRLQGTIPSKSDSKVIEGVTYKISLHGSQSGKVIIDNKSGWISKAAISMSITETKTARKGEESEQVIQKTENNIYIN